MKEQLSSWLDNEFDDRDMARLLAAVKDDEEMKSTLARYNAIGHVIRTGSAGAGGTDLWKRVSAALDEEPIVLAPRPAAASRSRQRLVSYALAASLVAAALVVGKSFLNNAQHVFAVPTPMSLAQQSGLDRIRGVTTAQSRFDDYLLVHNESAQLAGTGGLLPYARLVSVNHR